MRGGRRRGADKEALLTSGLANHAAHLICGGGESSRSVKVQHQLQDASLPIIWGEAGTSLFGFSGPEEESFCPVWCLFFNDKRFS